MFSPRCEPISTRQSVFSMSVGSGAAALGERGAGESGAAVALHHVLDEAHADAVVEHGDRLGAVLGLDLLHLLGDEVHRLVPRHRRPLLLAALALAQQRLLQPVGVVVRADGTGAARAQAAAALRVERVADELPQPAVAHVGNSAAAPEAHLAEGRDGLHLAAGPGGLRQRRDLRGNGTGAEARRRNLEESPA